MNVKEYLINRIMELELDLKQSRNECSATKYSFKKKQEELNEKMEQYQYQIEHIKELITCNLTPNSTMGCYLSLSGNDNDLKTLLAILNIKPEDYEEVIPDAKAKD